MNYDEPSSISIGGVVVDGITDLSWSRKEPDYGCDLSSLRGEPISVTAECKIPGTLEAFARLFRKEPPGASANTLARRVRYGGRKGRRALERLFDRALPIVFTTDLGVSLHGRAVIIDPENIHVRLRGRRR